jgi:hypothetical protein
VREKNVRQQEQQTLFFLQKSTLASLQLRPIQPKPEQIWRTEHWDEPDRSDTELFREKSRPERDWPEAVAPRDRSGKSSSLQNSARAVSSRGGVGRASLAGGRWRPWRREDPGQWRASPGAEALAARGSRAVAGESRGGGPGGRSLGGGPSSGQREQIDTRRLLAAACRGRRRRGQPSRQQGDRWSGDEKLDRNQARVARAGER